MKNEQALFANIHLLLMNKYICRFCTSRNWSHQRRLFDVWSLLICNTSLGHFLSDVKLTSY